MDSVGKSLAALIADEVQFGVGYFGLLYSSYTLVLDLWVITIVHITTCSHRLHSEILQNRPQSSNPLVRLTKNRLFFRIGLFVAVVLGILSAKEISSNGTISHTGNIEHIVSTILFLVLTLLQAFQTVVLARAEHSSQCIFFYLFIASRRWLTHAVI
jgi:hypothetical protein